MLGKLLSNDGRERRVATILIRQNRVLYAPFNAEFGVIPEYPTLIFGTVEVAALIKELGRFAQHYIPVCEPGRNVYLSPILGGKHGALPLSERWRARPYVNSYVEHFSRNHPAQLGLWVFDLIMEASECVLDRSRVIILNKMVSYSELRKLTFVIALEEESALILEHRRLNQKHARN